MLSSYLNTHLPLPCQLNSLNSMRKTQPLPPHEHHSSSVPSSPTKRKNSHTSPSLMQKHGSVFSLSSVGSTPNSLGSVKHNHSEVDSFQSSEHGGIYDTTSLTTLDGTESAVSSRSSRQKSLLSGEEEEEGCTIGGVTRSVSTNSLPKVHRLSTSRGMATSSLTCSEHQLAQSQVVSRMDIDSAQVHSNDRMVLPRLQVLLCKVLVYMHRFITWVIFILLKGLEPFSKKSTFALMAVERQRSPLTNALFCLGSEVSSRPCPHLWACAQNTQLSLLVLVGGGVERFLWRELRVLLHDEVNWTRALYSLRHTLWPGGVFMKSKKTRPTEEELEQLKRRAANAFKKFLPSMCSGLLWTGFSSFFLCVLFRFPANCRRTS